jgi:hypothetical protein
MRRIALPLFLCLSSCDCGVDPLAPVPGRVAGLLCSEDDGLPVAGVSVAILDDTGAQLGTTETDAGGNFLIDRVPAGPAVLVVDAGKRSLDLVVDSELTTAVSDPACRDVPPGPGFGDIVGTICNRHVGSLVQNATVTVLLPDNQTQATTTDDQGRFQLWNVPTGRRAVVVSAEGFQRSWAVDVVEGTAVEIQSDGDCRAPTANEGMLAGAFCDPSSNGDLLTGAAVIVTDADERVHGEPTDENGAFLLGPMVPGAARVHVTKGSFVFDTTTVIVAGGTSQVTNGGGCVPEDCREVIIESETDGRMELVLVVDRSGSMTSGAPGYAGTRWEGVVGALDNVTAELQSRVAFGLALFPSLDSAECGTATLAVEPAFDNAGAITALLDDFYTEPLGATPTAAALEAVLDWHVAHPPDLPRAVMLATDGGPNCNASLDPSSCRCSSGADDDCAQSFEPLMCLDDVSSVAAVQSLRALGLDTYVIGIPGVENFGDVLDAMAEAGGTDNYYLARDTGLLEAAVGDIGRRAGGCSLDVTEDLAAAARLEVAIDGVSIARDPLRVDGFDVVDAEHLELYGDACESWLSAGTLALSLCTIAGSDP